MKFLGPVSLILMHSGDSYRVYSRCLPPQTPAPNSRFSFLWSMMVYPKERPPPTDTPSSNAGRHMPVRLKSEYWTFAPTHHPENTYHGQ